MHHQDLQIEREDEQHESGNVKWRVYLPRIAQIYPFLRVLVWLGSCREANVKDVE